MAAGPGRTEISVYSRALWNHKSGTECENYRATTYCLSLEILNNKTPLENLMELSPVN